MANDLQNSDDDKTWWNQRSKLERRLIIGLVVIVVLVLGCVVYASIKPKKVTVSSDSCTTPSCLQAASQIVTHVDPSVDPCDNFFKFACGKFIEHTHGDVKAASIQGIGDQVERQMAEIIKEPIRKDDHGIIKYQKEMYQACMNKTAMEEESLDLVKKHIDVLKGWPVTLEHIKWKEGLFDWTKMTYKLRTLGYNYESMIGVYTMIDLENKHKHILRIYPPYISKIKDEHKELYIDYMTDVAVKFGAEKHQAKLAIEKVWDFRENLRLAGETSYTYDNETETNYTAEFLSSRFTIDEYQEYNPKIDWLELINNIIGPAANLSGSDYVIFPKDEFMNDFFTLTRRTRKRVQANYMIWSMIEELMPFLSKELKALYENYKCLTDGSSSESKERHNFCKRITTHSFRPSPTNIMYARRYLPQEKRERVQELFGSIKAEFKDLMMATTWMDEESKEKASEKVDNVIEIIGAPADYLNDSVFDIYGPAGDENVEDSSFLSLYLRRAVVFNDMSFDELNEVVNRSNIEEYYYDMSIIVNAMFSPYDNIMILPAAILQGIFYDQDRPMYLNYGAIGSIMGHELTHGFCKDGSKYDKNGKENSIWSEETKKNYEEKAECVVRDAENFDLEDTEKKINGTLTLEENVADYTGIKVSYAAYKKWVEEHGEEPQLPGIDYTPEQLFWISAISYECYKASAEKFVSRMSCDSHAHNEYRAIGPMRNNEDFANDFDCPINSNMNPSKKCKVF